MTEQASSQRKLVASVEACHLQLESEANRLDQAKRVASSSSASRTAAKAVLQAMADSAAAASRAQTAAQMSAAELAARARPRRVALKKALAAAEKVEDNARAAMTEAEAAEAANSVAQTNKLAVVSQAAQIADEEASGASAGRMSAKVNAEKLEMEADAARLGVSEAVSKAQTDSTTEMGDVLLEVQSKQQQAELAFENVEAARQKLVQNNITSGKLAESAALLEDDVKRVEALAEQRKRGAVSVVSEWERALQVAEADNRVAQKQVAAAKALSDAAAEHAASTAADQIKAQAMEMRAEENKAAADKLNMQVRGQQGCLWLPVYPTYNTELNWLFVCRTNWRPRRCIRHRSTRSSWHKQSLIYWLSRMNYKMYSGPIRTRQQTLSASCRGLAIPSLKPELPKQLLRVKLSCARRGLKVRQR